MAPITSSVARSSSGHSASATSGGTAGQLPGPPFRALPSLTACRLRHSGPGDASPWVTAASPAAQNLHEAARLVITHE